MVLLLHFLPSTQSLGIVQLRVATISPCTRTRRQSAATSHSRRICVAARQLRPQTLYLCIFRLQQRAMRLDDGGAGLEGDVVGVDEGSLGFKGNSGGLQHGLFAFDDRGFDADVRLELHRKRFGLHKLLSHHPRLLQPSNGGSLQFSMRHQR